MSETAPIWVLTDDRAGNVGQCLGVAEALGLPFEVKDIRYGRLGGLPNLLRGASLTGITASSAAALVAPWPRVVIAAGRRTAPVARWIKRRSGAMLVQIMDPGPGGRAEFDIIAVPGHDECRLTGGYVLPITGAPHRVTPAKLAQAAEMWAPRFAHLPRPWVAVIVGGATRRRPFTPAMAAELGRRAGDLAGGGSLLVTTSRRTGAESEQALLAAIPQPSFIHRWGAAGDNPYFGFLALADALVVTGDSVSMACEACASPAPVYLFAPDGWVVAKHARLHAQLYALGLARPLNAGTRLERWSHPPLNAAADIAAAIRARLAC
ncbi:putative nucleoside-diphosphate-sugar epimerase [Magnetospirillum sp. LM-5]|uniref:mitochondrial fission ELM1 family protein n=1 Tax=Magnetospirillum sp. LM-5 TaxID=2681466 RepID=UPI00137FB3D7|nr:mitochondrial fission ELM1 family protein [Magnetospirillum sp. LM-5]CAA7611474.1 putative nucleoside-diphosphate-sugar epimerase [Magnetospirillum sp. LM-5]